MNTPFIYGKSVKKNNFTDRTKERKTLIQNFNFGINTIILSPRRWGKTSLVRKAGQEFCDGNKKARVIYIDLFNIRSEEEFYKILSEKVIAAISNKAEEWISNTKEFFTQRMPSISFTPQNDEIPVSLGLNWKEVSKDPNEILNLAENIAKKKGLKIAICIDEFQNLSNFEAPLDFQKKLRANWQHHENVSYCLYGSKRHMMLDIFTNSEQPFYKFGDLIFLEKISNEDWQIFITKQFRATGKKITKIQAGRIATQVDNHSYYVQQLAQLCWLRTEDKLDDATINEALDSLTMQLSLLFQNITDGLSSPQLYFLKAVLDGVVQYSAKATLDTYKLGTSANIPRIKTALINKEIIDERTPGKVDILDPIYSRWLKYYFFI